MTAPYVGLRRWLTADEARKLACRGVWARRVGSDMRASLTDSAAHAVGMFGMAAKDTEFLWMSVHPDDLTDAPQGRTVEPDPLADLTRRVEALEGAKAADRREAVADDWRTSPPQGGRCAWVNGTGGVCTAWVKDSVWYSRTVAITPPAHAVLLVRP